MRDRAMRIDGYLLRANVRQQRLARGVRHSAPTPAAVISLEDGVKLAVLENIENDI